MTDKINWDLILSYLEGNYTEEQEKKIKEWIQLNNKNMKDMDLIKQIWDTPENLLPKPDVEEALRKVATRAGIDFDAKDTNRARILPFESRQRRKPVIQRVLSAKILRVAAVLLLMMTASYFIFKTLQPSSMKKISVENTKQEKIILSDGTRVTLDAGSFFSFPEKFSVDKREVFLNGEGYFKVTADREKPFVIHANDGLITVVGTEFNARAWRQNKKVVVVVVDGKVSLRPDKAIEKNAEVFISKGQISQLIENEMPSAPQYTNVGEHLTWLNHEMYFKNTPLREVLDQLERWYDLEFYLSDDSLASNRITIFIENKPIEDILDLLSLINNFKYERYENKVTFSPIELN